LKTTYNNCATARGANLDILQYAMDNNIINFTDIQAQIEMKKREELLSKHPYSIWEGINDKKWYTYLPDEAKSRKKKLIKRTTRESLEKAIIKFWKEQESNKQISTFKDAYWLWRSKHDCLVSANSVAKYESDYKRFYKDTEFEEMRLHDLMDDDINLFMVQTIRDKKLQREATRKLFSNIKDVISIARKYGAMTHNPVEFIKAKDFYKHCKEEYKSDTEKIFSQDELILLLHQIQKDHLKKPNYIPVYAVEMAMFTGMRAGELPAIRWDKITDDYIIIDSSEKANPKKTEFYIDKTKTGKIRFFPIDDAIRDLLDRIKTVQEEYGYDSEYVFANEHGRIHSKNIYNCLTNKCRQVKIQPRGITALRKTFNSAISTCKLI